MTSSMALVLPQPKKVQAPERWAHPTSHPQVPDDAPCTLKQELDQELQALRQQNSEVGL